MRDLVVLLLHLVATAARLAGPGGARSVVAEPVRVSNSCVVSPRDRQLDEARQAERGVLQEISRYSDCDRAL
jgi:hypothetical protein